MGEIHRRKVEHVRHDVLMIGQAPGADNDTRPLVGTMGVDLAKLCGLAGVPDPVHVPEHPPTLVKTDELVGLYFSRANVLDEFPGPGNGKGHAFPTRHARLAALAMWPEVRTFERVLFVGKQTKDAFVGCASMTIDERGFWLRGMEMLTWYVRPDELAPGGALVYAWMPHTSKVNQFWNDPANVTAAARFLTDLTQWTLWSVAAVA